MNTQPFDSIVPDVKSRINKKRFEIWLWLLEVYQKGLSYDPNLIGTSQAMNYLSQSYASGYDAKVLAIEEYKNYIIKDEYFDWIGFDDSQLSWIDAQHSAEIICNEIELPSKLKSRDRTIAIIDLIQLRKDKKIKYVENLKSKWNAKIYNNEYLKWLSLEKESEPELCEYAWKFIRKNRPDETYGMVSPKSLNDLAAMLNDPAFNFLEAHILFSKLKSAWTQKKYRENMKGKKQYNIVLSDDAIKSLEKIAKRSKLKKNEILEILIKMEEKNKKYISHRIWILEDDVSPFSLNRFKI